MQELIEKLTELKNDWNKSLTTDTDKELLTDAFQTDFNEIKEEYDIPSGEVADWVIDNEDVPVEEFVKEWMG